jgi:hypothetical protein
MDLKQCKLSKSEWDTIENPINENEMEVLKLINEGFNDVNIKINKNNSLFNYLKIEYNPQIENYLFNNYIAEKIKTIILKYKVYFINIDDCNKNIKHDKEFKTQFNYNTQSIIRLKSSDKIRLNRTTINNISNLDIYEFILLKHIELLFYEKKDNNYKWQLHYYTLHKLILNNVTYINQYLIDIIKTILINFEEEIDLLNIINHSVDFIEKNSDLLKYNDLTLYEHQKEIFTIVKQPNPKLILYIAPTGTGKTLTPIGLSNSYKVIFVCAARHVGLALARSAISMNKKIAFAFGCNCAEDVRLHYSAAKEYTKDRRSGQIRKVDNSVGHKVEIMICDIRSYTYAMFYMLAFNSASNIITYWDEPTITMDYKEHELHSIIKQNWNENIIPNLVLSSATLPKQHELTETIADFNNKFIEATIHNIVSYDCRKTIPIVNNNGYIVMPHYLSNNYDDILRIVKHCEDNLTLLRYLDLNECSKFILFVEENNFIKSNAKHNRSFASINDINMMNIKLHYLKTLKNIKNNNWSIIYSTLVLNRQQKIIPNMSVDTKGNKIIRANSVDNSSMMTTSKKLYGKPLTKMCSEQIINTNSKINTENNGLSSIYVTTKDAYTLTDGPTIFLATNVSKIAKFCIQQANIPSNVMQDIMDKIEFNNQINEKISEIETQLQTEEDKLCRQMNGDNNNNSKKDKKSKEKLATNVINKSQDKNINKLREQIIILRSMIKSASLDDLFIPNKLTHLKKWAEDIKVNNPFTSSIDEEIVCKIMSLNDVDDSWKILLLLGIGVFTQHKSNSYTEIMKQLADTQRLYLIIADSDYIYGTNYQFCHGYISKDLQLTQEKIIQALGRIGRNNIQQEYTARFRDEEQINTLFTTFEPEDKPEVINMNILFNSKNVKWNGYEYEEIEETK